MDNKKILSAATEIQTHLFKLLDKKQAELVKQQLQTLLSKAKAGEEVNIDILDVLGEYEATQQWMDNKLKGTSAAMDKGFSPLAGDHKPPPSLIYQCAKAHTKRFPKVPATAPICPECKLPMTRQS
jgi:hypothetical protein